MKKSTKFVVAAGAMMMIGSAAFAQKQCNLALTVIATPSTVNYGDTSHVSIKITNNGPASLATNDTIYYGQIGSASVFSLLPSAAIPSGGSETFTNELYYRHGMDTLTADRTLNFCFKLYAQSAITIDPDGTGPLPSRTATTTYIDPVATNDSTCVTITLKKKPTTGVFEFGNSNKEPLTIYPNPATNNISFELNFTQAENVQVSVKDLTGREVMRKDFGRIQAGNTTPFNLDISRLQAGMYIIELNGEDRKALGKFTKR